MPQSILITRNKSRYVLHTKSSDMLSLIWDHLTSVVFKRCTLYNIEGAVHLRSYEYVSWFFFWRETDYKVTIFVTTIDVNNALRILLSKLQSSGVCHIDVSKSRQGPDYLAIFPITEVLPHSAYKNIFYNRSAHPGTSRSGGTTNKTDSLYDTNA